MTIVRGEYTGHDNIIDHTWGGRRRAGGVTVSYFEWVQDLQSYFWTETQINRRLKQILSKAFREMHSLAQSTQVDMRTAALMQSVGRVAEGMRKRGLFP
ncbi:MAG: hypothetical protein HYZ81_22375 [Nitrospinae bacterium]|nr:hypothetical protein [Nitrospinota bacterium]